jgi:hypothetical protein
MSGDRFATLAPRSQFYAFDVPSASRTCAFRRRGGTFGHFLIGWKKGAASANVPLADPSPNARLPEAANDDGVAWPLIRFPDGWHAACQSSFPQNLPLPAHRPEFLAAAGRWQIVGPEVAHTVNKALHQRQRYSQAPDRADACLERKHADHVRSHGTARWSGSTDRSTGPAKMVPRKAGIARPLGAPPT